MKSITVHLIRNIFDQYDQAENRLTHALAQVFASDQRLTREFIRFAVGANPPPGALSLSCQVFPEEQLEPLSEEEADRQGIPDLWIWSGPDKWAVLCECKVTAEPTIDQLQRHSETVRRLGFKSAHLVVITAEESRPSALGKRVDNMPVAWTNWPTLFVFLSRYTQGNDLVTQFLDYLRIVEGHLMAEGYDGSPLTTFTGIPFGPDHPYSEPEAKVVLRALMAGFRRRLVGSRFVQINPSIRRPALVGAWDVVGFKFADPARPFNKYPHLSLGIGRDSVGLRLIVPHQAIPGYWNRIRRVSKAQLKDALDEVAHRLRRIQRHVVRDIWEPQLHLRLYQRHFYAQRMGTVDGEIKFGVDTLSVRRRRSRAVKTVPAWLDAIYAVLAQTSRANFELALTVEYPLVNGSVARRKEFTESLVLAAEAFGPFLTMLTATRYER